MVRCSPSPDCPPSGRAVGVRHPRAVGVGVWVWGPNTVPLACMPCGGCVPRGWWGAVPGGGWPATLVRGVWCQALSLPWPPVLWGGQPGFRDPCVPGAVGVVVGTHHRPHGARTCGPALSAVGVAEGRFWGEGAVRRCEARLGSGAPPPPAARPLGGLSGSATHVLWTRVCGRGGPAPWPACPVGGCAPRGWRGRPGSSAPSSLLPALWAGCRGPLAACRGCGCGCVRCVWCLCGACRGAGCCPSPVPLVPPSLVLCCGVVLPVCLLCPLPCAGRLLVCWLPPVSFVASSFFTLSPALRWLALLPGMHVFPASALVCVSVFPLTCFLGPDSRALFFLSCWVL